MDEYLVAAAHAFPHLRFGLPFIGFGGRYVMPYNHRGEEWAAIWGANETVEQLVAGIRDVVNN